MLASFLGSNNITNACEGAEAIVKQIQELPEKSISDGTKPDEITLSIVNKIRKE